MNDFNSDLGIPQLDYPEGIKLTKNSKGYTWEIKLKVDTGKVVDEAFIKRLDAVNTMLLATFSMDSVSS